MVIFLLGYSYKYITNTIHCQAQPCLLHTGYLGVVFCINDPVENVCESRWAGKRTQDQSLTLEAKHMLLMIVSKANDKMLKTL